MAIGSKNSFFKLYLLLGLFISIMIMARETCMAETIKETNEPKKAVGWHWYNERYPEETKEPNFKEAKKNEKTAMSQMAILRQAVREAKARAILYPSEENVRSYLILQNFVVSKAAMFTQVWQKTLLNYPELDYSISHPTQSSVQHVLSAEIRKKEDEAIQAFGKKYGMFFFYRGDNPLDQALAPIIESFSRENQVSLLPVSMDGKTLEILGTNQQINHGQAERLGVKYFPALILVDPKNQKVQPLHYGFVADSDLRRRFLQIATDFQNGV